MGCIDVYKYWRLVEYTVECMAFQLSFINYKVFVLEKALEINAFLLGHLRSKDLGS